MKYKKPHLSFEQQADQLIARNLIADKTIVSDQLLVVSEKWLVINKTNPTLTTNSLNINHYNVGGGNE